MNNFINFCSNEKDWIDVFTALMPILLSGFAVYFTYQQNQISKRKRNDDLYDKRFEVYNQFLNFLNLMNFEKGWSDELSDLFFNKIKPKHFLFGIEIKSLIDDVEKKYREIGSFKSDGEHFYPEKTLNEVPNYKALIEYFWSLPVTLEKNFEPYLRLKNE